MTASAFGRRLQPAIKSKRPALSAEVSRIRARLQPASVSRQERFTAEQDLKPKNRHRLRAADTIGVVSSQRHQTRLSHRRIEALTRWAKNPLRRLNPETDSISLEPQPLQNTLNVQPTTSASLRRAATAPTTLSTA